VLDDECLVGASALMRRSSSLEPEVVHFLVQCSIDVRADTTVVMSVSQRR
jgi:hypothetical protein